MTIEQTIKKAIRGGYDFKGYMKKPDAFYEYQRMGELYNRSMLLTIYWHEFDNTKNAVKRSREFWDEQFFLDPLFWQCLGKAMGWEERELVRDEGEDQAYYYSFPWKKCWHSFIDHLAKGKTAEDFFKELTNPS